MRMLLTTILVLSFTLLSPLKVFAAPGPILKVEAYLVAANEIIDGNQIFIFPHRPVLTNDHSSICTEFADTFEAANCILEGTLRNRYGLIAENSRLHSELHNQTWLSEEEYFQFLTDLLNKAEALDWTQLEMPVTYTIAAFKPINILTLTPVRPLLEREGFFVTRSHIDTILDRIKSVSSLPKVQHPRLRSQALDLAIVKALSDLENQSVKVSAPEFVFPNGETNLIQKNGIIWSFNIRFDQREKLLIGLLRLKMAMAHQSLKPGQMVVLYDQVPSSSNDATLFHWESRSGGIDEALELVDHMMQSVDHMMQSIDSGDIAYIPLSE